MDTFCLGLDVGGTKLEVVALSSEFVHPGVDPLACVLTRERTPTRAELGYDAVIEAAADLVRSVLAHTVRPGSRVTLGVALPGGISRRTGQVKNSNATCLNGHTFREDLSRVLEMGVVADNDANLFALAEATWGAGRGAGSVFGVILGSGVGGGLVMGGRIHTGLQGIAGEWGHNVLVPEGNPCYCGKRGCVETYLSGKALERELRGVGIFATAAEFSRDLQRGIYQTHPGAQAVVTRYLEWYGRGLASVINLLDPEVIVLGGGMGQFQPLYREGRKQVEVSVFNDELLTSIVPPRLGDSAGVFGAALLGLQLTP